MTRTEAHNRLVYQTEMYIEMYIWMERIENPEPRICSTFGCRKVLTITEQLAGTKCLACQGNKDNRFLHYKI